MAGNFRRFQFGRRTSGGEAGFARVLGRTASRLREVLSDPGVYSNSSRSRTTGGRGKTVVLNVGSFKSGWEFEEDIGNPGQLGMNSPRPINVTQTLASPARTLLYRRLPVGSVSSLSWALDRTNDLQVGNLRYSRPEVCVTS